jgi:hypothetical protein
LPSWQVCSSHPNLSWHAMTGWGGLSRLAKQVNRVRWWGGVRWRGWLDMLQHVNTPPWLDTPSQVKTCSSQVDELTGMKIFWACVKIFWWGWVKQLEFKHAKVSCQSDRIDTLWCVLSWAQANAWHACMPSSSNWDRTQRNNTLHALQWSETLWVSLRIEKCLTQQQERSEHVALKLKHNYLLVMLVLSPRNKN